ncbi:RidA family protein [Paenibacillus solisilvae]|uniref:RidA family protein n=1 Tax=Paenibacillus solisilvae TaxID=2486751 RepID=A0ABW0VYL5_9BACL
MNILQRLEDLQITLAPPVSNNKPYGTYVVIGNMVFLSGHGPDRAGAKWKGGVGTSYSVEEGYTAARSCAVNLLSTLQAAVPDLNAVRIVKVTGFVQAPSGFAEQPQVINGCSDLLRELYGDERGKHARSAIGVASLPNDWPVEIEMIAEIVQAVTALTRT